MLYLRHLWYYIDNKDSNNAKKETAHDKEDNMYYSNINKVITLLNTCNDKEEELEKSDGDEDELDGLIVYDSKNNTLEYKSKNRHK